MSCTEQPRRLADEPVLTVPEACELLKLSERAVRQKVADGTLQTVALGDRCAVRIINPLLDRIAPATAPEPTPSPALPVNGAGEREAAASDA
jgi:excisionase family DNA binding protein